MKMKSRTFLIIGFFVLALSVLVGCELDTHGEPERVLRSEEDTYVVTFYLDNGTDKVVTQTAQYDDMLQRPADPKWVGHTFLGWFWEGSEKWREQGDSMVNFETVKVHSNYKIHARWRAKAKYEVTYDYDTEGVSNGVQTVYDGTKIAQPLDPQKDKFFFLMWVNEDGTEFDFDEPISANTTIKAKWIRAAIYDVTFDYNNGTPNGGFRVTEESGWKVPKPEDPTKEGLDFDCWTLNGEKFDFDNYTVVNEITLVASYKRKESYAIGDTGPGGGYVFYDKGKDSDGWRYLEVAKSHIGFMMYGYYHDASGTNCGVGTSTLIGKGKENTQRLVEAMGETAYTTDWGTEKDIYAACACYKKDLFNNGYDDWFLPSYEELDLIYECLFVRKNIRWGDVYWFVSSSENNNTAYLSMDFNFGKRNGEYKFMKNYVLPVRAF